MPFSAASGPALFSQRRLCRQQPVLDFLFLWRGLVKSPVESCRPLSQPLDIISQQKMFNWKFLSNVHQLLRSY